MGDFQVVVGAGTMQSTATDALRFPNQWVSDGVTVQAVFRGAELLHLAAAGCVLNDVYREADRLGISISGVQVTASGNFDTDIWKSTGIEYIVNVDSPASPDVLAELLTVVDSVAEIPRAIRAGASVIRVDR